MANVKRRGKKHTTKFTRRSVDKCKVLFQQAQHFHQTGLLTKAENLYKEILETIPDNPDCLHYLGLVYFQKGDSSKAELNFKKAIQISNNPVYLSNYGMLLRNQLKFNEALDLYKKAIEQQPDYAEAWFNYGITNKDLGNYEAAEEAYKKAISIKNDYIKALYNLAVIQESQGKTNEANETIKKIQNISPDNYQLYHTMGIALQYFGGSKNIKKSLEFFKKALEIEPNSLETLIALAKLQRDTNKPETALKVYEKILSIEPEYLEIRIEYAKCLIATNQPNLAEQELIKLKQNNQDNIPISLTLGQIAIIKGNFEEAETIFKNVLINDMNCVGAYAGLANCKKYNNEDIELLNKIKEITENKESSSIYFALGKVHNDFGNFDESFEAYAKANYIRNKRIEYDSNFHTNKIKSIIDVFNTSLIDRTLTYGHQSKTPIFILGSPRSGTTLTEQIISSHPQVVGAGELPFIEFLATNRLQENSGDNNNYPERIKFIKNDEIISEAEIYLGKIQSMKQDGILHITDKMTSNYLYLGYILILFPYAKIIYCNRNPLDACLSMFFQNFESSVQFSFSLENLGHWYKEYLHLMQHWKSLFGNKIFDINYNDIVTDTEITSKKMIDFCELEWDERCLKFYKTKRNINTASQWQVRQPIYKTSLDKWKRYDKHIGILKEILDGYY